MTSIRRTTAHSLLDHRRNSYILAEMNVDAVENKPVQSGQKWLNHVRRMEDISYPK